MNGRVKILYAEDNPHDADMTRAKFAEHATMFDFEVVDNAQACLKRLGEAKFDLLLLDNHLPDMDGLDVLKALLSAGSDLPVVLVTGAGDEELVVKALRLGAANYVPKTGKYLMNLPDLLFGIVDEDRRKRSLGIGMASSPLRILYVEHLEMDVDLTLSHFAEHAPHFETDVVRSCREAMARLAERQDYDLALIDLRMPDLTGLEFVRMARRRQYRVPPFIMISGKGDDEMAIATLRLGASDYIAKRDGYLNQLVYCIENAVTHHRLEQLNLQLQQELASRRRTEASLREAQERLERSVSAGNVGLWDWDLVTNQIYYSEEWKRQIGYAGDEIPDRVAEWKSRIHPEDAERTLEKVNECLSGDLPAFETEFRLQHKNGTFRNILSRGSRIDDNKGRPARLLGSHVDITERTEIEAQYAQAQRLAVVGQLAGGIAHDFNNLLTVILGTAQLGLRDSGKESQIARSFQDIREAGLRAASLTRQLLAFSRKQILKQEVLSLNTLLANLEHMLRRLLGEDITLVVSPAGNLGCIRADPGQIEQVIMNLAVNARDAMPTGGTLTIETQEIQVGESFDQFHLSVECGPHAVLTVRDTGAGMDEATCARIFEPFFTTKERGRGTGLGLATVYGIVKQSGGDITVESKVGVGTTFRIYLPVVEAEAADCAPVRPLAEVAGTGTILVVEDDQSVRALVGQILDSAGFSVLTADSGADAMELLATHPEPIHLVVTDVVMPGMSGRELASRIAEAHPETKVLFTSGYTDDAVLRYGVDHRTCYFIEKPFSADELAGKVREVLESGPLSRTQMPE